MTRRNILSGSTRLTDPEIIAAVTDWDDQTLGRGLAHIAGLMAARSGDYYAAQTLRNVADALLRPKR
jgi:hypothetical protein